MEKQTYTKSDIQELKEKAKAMNPAVKVIHLSELELDKNSISTNLVKLNGTEIRVADGFIRNLANILNVNVKLEKNLKSDEEHGQEMLSTLLNALKSFSAKKRVPQVTLVGDVKNGILTNVVSGNFARLSNEGLFNVAEDLLKKHDGLELIGCNVSDTLPDITMKLLAPNPIKLVDSNDEVFNFGLTLSNTAVNSYVGDFAYRLVCTNGMMGLKSENQFKLSDIGTQGLLDLQQHLTDVAGRGFMPLDFESNIDKAQNVEASYYEVEQAFNFVKGQLNCTDDQRGRMEMALATRWFEGYLNSIDKLKRNNIDHKSLDKKQKQFFPSGMSKWDLINNITHLGSNKVGFEFYNQDELQVYGGKLMSKPADLAHMNFLHLK